MQDPKIKNLPVGHVKQFAAEPLQVEQDVLQPEHSEPLWKLVAGQHPVPELQVRHPPASQVAALQSEGQPMQELLSK